MSTHCLLLFAIEARDLPDSIKSIFSSRIRRHSPHIDQSRQISQDPSNRHCRQGTCLKKTVHDTSFPLALSKAVYPNMKKTARTLR